ncbi:MAG: hypothetical protein ACKV19_02810 [Verrucomicrobiales bacterium]
MPTVLSTLCVLMWLPAVADEGAKGPSPEAAKPSDAGTPDGKAPLTAQESAFAAMLTNATLRGTWAPIDQRLLGEEHKDGYRILRAEKLGEGKWALVSRLQFQGQEITVPFPVTVHFAADVAVLVLDKIPLGDGSLWSARILFHDDVYAGSWWGADKATKSGVVSGTITREPQK